MWNWIAENLNWLAPTLSSIILSGLIIMVAWKQKNLRQQSLYIREEQKEIQKQSIKLALLDRRLTTYALTRAFIESVIAAYASPDPDLSYGSSGIDEFTNASYEAELLFEDEVCAYIKKVVNNAKKIDSLAAQIESDASRYASDAQDQFDAIYRWFQAQPKAAAQLFDRYINVNTLDL